MSAASDMPHVKVVKLFINYTETFTGKYSKLMVMARQHNSEKVAIKTNKIGKVGKDRNQVISASHLATMKALIRALASGFYYAEVEEHKWIPPLMLRTKSLSTAMGYCDKTAKRHLTRLEKAELIRIHPGYFKNGRRMIEICPKFLVVHTNGNDRISPNDMEKLVKNGVELIKQDKLTELLTLMGKEKVKG